jgi:hypothetical protein
MYLFPAPQTNQARFIGEGRGELHPVRPRVGRAPAAILGRCMGIPAHDVCGSGYARACRWAGVVRTAAGSGVATVRAAHRGPWPPQTAVGPTPASTAIKCAAALPGRELKGVLTLASHLAPNLTPRTHPMRTPRIKKLPLPLDTLDWRSHLG